MSNLFKAIEVIENYQKEIDKKTYRFMKEMHKAEDESRRTTISDINREQAQKDFKWWEREYMNNKIFNKGLETAKSLIQKLQEEE